MMEERVIDGVMHRLEGKSFMPLTAEELTARLLEARRMLDERKPVWVQPAPFWTPRDPWMPPVWSEPTSADPPIPGITITCETKQ